MASGESIALSEPATHVPAHADVQTSSHDAPATVERYHVCCTGTAPIFSFNTSLFADQNSPTLATPYKNKIKIHLQSANNKHQNTFTVLRSVENVTSPVPALGAVQPTETRYGLRSALM